MSRYTPTLIPYYGSKSGFPAIHRLIPEMRNYLEPYCGSAAVFWSRSRPEGVETLNDIDHNLVALFTAVRDHGKEIRRRMERTPCSRQFHQECREKLLADPNLTPIDRALCYWVCVTQSRDGSPYRGGWSFSTSETRRGLPCSIAKAQSRIDTLDWFIGRLRSAQIENQHATKVIARYDRKDTAGYIDPPYPLSTRNGSSYLHEMTDHDHKELSDLLHRCRGKYVISSYISELYLNLYDDWWRVEHSPVRINAGPNRPLRQEVVWCNFDPSAIVEEINRSA